MANVVIDAIRHLEKDLADILPYMGHNEVSEIILNPHYVANGTYEGHILADVFGVGLCNLVRVKQIINPGRNVNVGDTVIAKRACDGQVLYYQVLEAGIIDYTQVLADCLTNYFMFDEAQLLPWRYSELLAFANCLRNGILFNDKLTMEHSTDIVAMIERINPELLAKYGELLILTVIDSSNIMSFTKINAEIYTLEFMKMSATKAETIMSVLASITGKFIHNKSPRLECQIPKHGHRFTGVIPPASVFPAFCIRRHAPRVYSLDDFVASGILEASSRETIRSWVKRRFNILIAGGTGSGKTTLANAILQEINHLFPATRLLIIEDVPELQFNTSRSLALTVGEFFSMYDALRTTLRFKPDRIIMGEVRGAEAYTLLKAWNTGHPGGLATIHANGVNEALYRFESCIRDAVDGRVNRQELGFTINGIISIQNLTIKEKRAGEVINTVKRKVTALRQIVQYDLENDVFQDIIFDKIEESFD